MNCYRHRDTPAVGLCLSCGRALCGDCAEELSGGLACRTPCARHIDSDARGEAQAISCFQIRLSRVVVVTFGILVMVLGMILCLSRCDPSDIALCPLGMLCVLIGAAASRNRNHGDVA